MFDFKKTSPIANEFANKALKEIWGNINQLRNYCGYEGMHSIEQWDRGLKAIATFKSDVEWFEYFYHDEKEIYSYEKGDGIDIKIIKAVSDGKEFLDKELSKISELDKDATITFDVEINYVESKFEENLEKEFKKVKEVLERFNFIKDIKYVFDTYGTKILVNWIPVSETSQENIEILNLALLEKLKKVIPDERFLEIKIDEDSAFDFIFKKTEKVLKEIYGIEFQKQIIKWEENKNYIYEDKIQKKLREVGTTKNKKAVIFEINKIPLNQEENKNLSSNNKTDDKKILEIIENLSENNQEIQESKKIKPIMLLDEFYTFSVNSQIENYKKKKLILINFDENVYFFQGFFYNLFDKFKKMYNIENFENYYIVITYSKDNEYHKKQFFSGKMFEY
jgi:hypothetical protein